MKSDTLHRVFTSSRLHLEQKYLIQSLALHTAARTTAELLQNEGGMSVQSYLCWHNVLISCMH